MQTNDIMKVGGLNLDDKIFSLTVLYAISLRNLALFEGQLIILKRL